MTLPASSTGTGCPSTQRFTFPRRSRLTASSDIREAYEQGEKYAGRCMILWIRRAPDACLRLAVISSRKIGPAVTRNRSRRRVRELFRLHHHQLTGQADLVVVCRFRLATAPWKELVAEFLQLTDRAGLLNPSVSIHEHPN